MSARWPVPPAAVALDLLDGEEHARAARLSADDPAFRAEVTRLRATTAALAGLGAEGWELEAPPPLESRALEPQAPAEAAPSAGRPRRRAPLHRARSPRRAPVFAAAAALAAAAVIAVVLLRDPGNDPIPAPPPTTLALRPLPGVPGRAQLTLNGAGTQAELRGAGLRPSGAHDYYEAWLADDRGRMVSMGTFRVAPDGRVDVHMEVAVDVSRYALVDVSLEPDDGNPAHSDRSVLRARL
jgi:anti-sigma-K factor RskA